MRPLSKFTFTITAAFAVSAAFFPLNAKEPATSQPDANATPVVVELFTSEGCSSCPPADQLLSKIGATQPINGARVIPLSFHVDYWDRLGWRDPFSSKEATARQYAYAEVTRSDRVYTPQMVVNGTESFIGNNAHKARTSISSAAAQSPRFDIEISDILIATDPEGVLTLRSNVRLDSQTVSNTPQRVMVAVTENDLDVDIPRGENRGLTLHHDHVVRAIRQESTFDPTTWDTMELEIAIPMQTDWKVENLSLVVFVQDPVSAQILGADAQVVQKSSVNRQTSP